MCCRDYAACIFAGLWSIIQTCFHLGFSIWGTNMYECKYQLDNTTFMYFWYLTYFYTNTCVNATADGLMLVVNSTWGNKDPTNYSIIKMHWQFPPESIAAPRTYYIFESFIIVDCLWLVTAVALLVGTCMKIRNNLAIFFFFPWTAILLVILFFDGIAAGWYGIDISYTYGLTNWFKFIGATNATGSDDVKMPSYSKTATTLPSILMALFFGRFFIIWLVNVFLFFRVVQASVNAAEDFDDEAIESKDIKGETKKTNVSNSKKRRDFQVKEMNYDRSRIRQCQVYSETDDDEEKEARERERRRPRRCSSNKQKTAVIVVVKIEESRENCAFRYDDFSIKETLAVGGGGGGYEGDRSSSPSPLPHTKGEKMRKSK